MRTLRKANISAEGAAIGWTAVFLAVLLALFAWDGAAEPTVEHLRTTGVIVSAQTETGPVELNTATKEQLMTLPGIGEVLADRILDYREEEGLFRAPEELMDVPGIGEKRFEALAGKITANGKGTT